MCVQAFVLVLITILQFTVDCHPGCISQLTEKEIFHIPQHNTHARSTPRLEPIEVTPAHIFNVTFAQNVPEEVQQSILNVLNLLESIISSDVRLNFNVMMTDESGENDWGFSNSTFWTTQYPNFLAMIPEESVTDLFPALSALEANIDWPSGYSWSDGQIVLTNWQAYGRGLIDEANSTFTFFIDNDYENLFDFNSTDGTPSDKFDFETLIMHELIHELGFYSVVDFLYLNNTNSSDVDWWIFPLDVFRFGYTSPTDVKNVLLDPREFDPTVGPHSFWDGSLPAAVEFERGVNYTGYNASHWRHQNNSLLFGVMDSNIPKGMSVGVSMNDVAAFRAMGWGIKDSILPILTAAFINGSFIVTHGNLLIGPTIKCRFNQTDIVDPADLAVQNGYKWINCPIPPALVGQNISDWFVELSNDGGNTWSNQIKASEELPDGDSSPASQIGGKSALFTLLMTIWLVCLSNLIF